MSAQQIQKEIEFKVIRVSSGFTLENASTHPVIGLTIPNQGNGEQAIEVHNPAIGLVGYPLVTTSGLGIYGTAQRINELDEATPHLNHAFLALFTLCATYRDLTAIAFEVDLANRLTVFIDTPTKEIFAWRAVNSNKIFVAERDKVIPKKDAITLDISELMYGFSVCAEHIRMGSNRFRVATYPETNDFLVSFYDHEKADIRVDINFPLLPREEKPTIQ